tara:strand:+ start:1290 stop:1451 length:162 start_codon:yes stop_codon:yes gene_type:complete
VLSVVIDWYNLLLRRYDLLLQNLLALLRMQLLYSAELRESMDLLDGKAKSTQI